MNSDKYDVFLSHHSKDKPLVEAIAEKLMAEGVKPFLDKWHLLPGQPWLDEIEHALNQTKACAIFIGQHGLAGPVQLAEMRSALVRKYREKNYPVIPVFLPKCRTQLPSYLTQYTWVEFKENINDREALQLLIKGISGDKENKVNLSGQKPLPGIALNIPKLLKSLRKLEMEDVFFIGEIIGIRRAEVSGRNITEVSVNLKARAEIHGKLEDLQKELIEQYTHIWDEMKSSI